MKTVSTLRRMVNRLRKRSFDGSASYWEARYGAGGNSGTGSYGRLAKFKSEQINKIVKRYDIRSVIEFGCGDGSQLNDIHYHHYVGCDVSARAIDICREKYQGDTTKSFFHVDASFQRSGYDMVVSLDVIFHLVEDAVYNSYMADIFDGSKALVLIYSSNYESAPSASSPHVRHRKFSDWVVQHRPCWFLSEHIENAYPFNGNAVSESFSDFYLFEKTKE